MTIPRCLSRADAAAHVGCGSIATFDRWVQQGILPQKIPGTNKWDRVALDAALDKIGGLSSIAPSNPLEEWRRARQAQRA